MAAFLIRTGQCTDKWAGDQTPATWDQIAEAIAQMTPEQRGAAAVLERLNSRGEFCFGALYGPFRYDEAVRDETLSANWLPPGRPFLRS